MKRVFMSVALLATTILAANAQKNTLLAGGNVSLSTEKAPGIPDDTKTTVFSFSPTVGYQFNNNWTAGIVADVASDKETEGSFETKSNGFAVGPFVRYAHNLSNLFAVYGQLETKFGGLKETQSNGSSSTVSKASTAEINLFPALFINFKNSFGLNFNIGGITYTNVKPKGFDGTNSFNFNFGKTVNIGISKNFNL
jgi:hypothetical protein